MVGEIAHSGVIIAVFTSVCVIMRCDMGQAGIGAMMGGWARGRAGPGPDGWVARAGAGPDGWVGLR